jgi:hypothetical protein
MIEKLKDNRVLITRVLLCVMTVFLVSGLFMTTSFADDDDHDDDFSFYRVASAAASYYDQTHNDKGDNEVGIKTFAQDAKTVKSVKNIGVAGDLVGFVDEDYSKGLFGATVSKLSASSQSRSYMSFRGNESALLAYVQYGHALQMLGLDSTANTSLDISAIVRFLGGGLLILAYSLAVMVSLLFKAVLTMLQALNPFAWFLGSHAVNVPFRSWFSGASKHMPTALSGVQELVSTLYSSMSAIGIVLIPIFFVMLVASIILFRSGRGAMGDTVGTKIRKYVTRVVFILAGIPILGASYTACLDALLSGKDSDAFSVSTSAANDVIGSTLVDFEAWAVNKRLALPKGVTIKLSGADTVGGSIDTKKTADLRQMARNINAMANKHLTTPTSTTSAMNGVAIDVGKESSSDNKPSVAAAYDVMIRYMTSTYYKAADLETQYKSTMAGKKIKSKKSSDNFFSWVISGFDDAPDSLMDLIENDSDVDNYKDANKLAGSDGTGPYMTDNKAGGISVEKNKKGSTFTYSGNGTRGLSTLAMYNYLTSEFSDSSVINYSNNKVAALVMSHAHRSVSAIGGGAVRALYVLYAIVMLIVMAIVGFGYALAVLFNMFKRGVSMVMSTPFALMGNFRAMSKVTTIVAMMIIELIGTVFAYQVVIYFLTHILDIFMIPVYKVLSGKSSAIVPIMNAIGVPAASTDSLSGQALQIAALVLAIIMLIVFSFKAMQLRKSFVKTMDEMAASLIDRIFSPGGVGAGGAGSAYASRPTAGDKVANGANKIAGAAGTGLAMAGANKLMNGKPLFGGLSKGDAAVSGSEVKNGADEDGNNGIEGGDLQGIPDPEDLNDPDGTGGSSLIEGAGGSSEEKTGQKLLGGESLDDNAKEIKADVKANGEAPIGKHAAPEGKSADGKPVAADGKVSKLTEHGKDAAKKAVAAGTPVGGLKAAADGAHKVKGLSQGAKAKLPGKGKGIAAANMSRSQLANASQAFGSKYSGSMGENEARATVAAAQDAQKQYGSAYVGQHVVTMAESTTKSGEYLTQARQHRAAARKMRAAVNRSPGANSYTFGGAVYDRSGMLADARRHELAADLCDRAVRLREERAVAARADAKQSRKAPRKTLSSNKTDGYL